MQPTIVFFDTKPYDEEVFHRVNAFYSFNFLYVKSRLSPETVSLIPPGSIVCLFVHDAVDARMAELLRQRHVPLIALRSNGYNHIDLHAMHDIRVVRVPKYSPYAVAEYAVGLLLCLNRKIHQSYCRTKVNNFCLQGLQGCDMHGKTVGVIGAGQIGSIVVRLLTAFGMEVLVHDQQQNSVLKEGTGCRYTSLEEIYRRADMITLHCPLFPENTHMISKESMALMKEGVLIVNTSRGGLINAHDLIEGLKSKKIGGAALDVYEEEEKFFFEDLSLSFINDDILARLMTFPNVIVTAHQAFFTQEALEEIAKTTCENISCFLTNRPLVNEVSAP